MAAEGQVIAIHTVEAWNQQFESSKTSDRLVVVDFTASWCGPCRFMAPILSDLAKKMPQVLFLKVDVDELPTVAEEWGVEAMPTFIFLKEGKKIDAVVGANRDDLQQKVSLHSSSSVQTA
ncbi:Thioredoxin H-type [Hibiscus syriacus]|uniref:Thioredoxin H-type n=1 Tax=Hibiscus syriacus TaxID=106335 RepID=A0A6A2XI41_HIBSY|nr:thioredoxin H1-like isoform X1 [Hibiscus syriacus]KAE8656057.1 Thioredoxin H-type [Hibiscus syriacus]